MANQGLNPPGSGIIDSSLFQQICGNSVVPTKIVGTDYLVFQIENRCVKGGGLLYGCLIPYKYIVNDMLTHLIFKPFEKSYWNKVHCDIIPY